MQMTIRIMISNIMTLSKVTSIIMSFGILRSSFTRLSIIISSK
jgi:hypothetical protein